jgi:hypothetical protein
MSVTASAISGLPGMVPSAGVSGAIDFLGYGLHDAFDTQQRRRWPTTTRRHA